MAQPTAGSPARPEAETKSAEEGDARAEEASVSADESDARTTAADVSAGGTPEGAPPWDDPEVFGDWRPVATPSQVPDTFRPLTRGQASPAERSNDEGSSDEVPLDVSRFLKRSNPWARTGIGVGVALALGLLGFAVSRGPGHSAAEEIVFASSGPHDAPSEALLAASLGIGRACGDGRATSPATVRATFRPEGNVESAVITGVHAGTPVGDCVAAKVREVRSKPFVGASSTITEQISLSR